MPSRLTAVKLWNNQFPETKILGLPVSQRMCDLVYMASRDSVDVLEKLGKSKFGFDQILKAKDTRALGTSLLIILELRVLVLTKRHVGSGNESISSHLDRVSLVHNPSVFHAKQVM